jgi:hypothetical protein
MLFTDLLQIAVLPNLPPLLNVTTRSFHLHLPPNRLPVSLHSGVWIPYIVTESVTHIVKPLYACMCQSVASCVGLKSTTPVCSCIVLPVDF